MDLESSLYVREGDAFIGTEATGGSWNPADQSGGAVLALLGHVLEDVPTLVPMSLARFTVDLVRPVPVGERLDVRSCVVREGKRIQVVDLVLAVGEVEHVRARALRLRELDASASPHLPAPTTHADPAAGLTRPDGPGVLHMSGRPGVPQFLRQGADVRRAPRDGSEAYGLWMRLLLPVVQDEPVRPTSRLTAAMDFANVIGVDFDPRKVTTINPDVTAHVLRPPVGEWTALVGDTYFAPELGRGVSTTTLSDLDGVFGFASTSQLVQPLGGR